MCFVMALFLQMGAKGEKTSAGVIFLKKQAGWQIFFEEVSSNLVTELLNFQQSPLSLALIKVEC